MTKEDNRYCAGCDYFSSSGSGEEAEDSCCMYIVREKRRRPDPGGVGCRLHTKKGEKMAEWNKEKAAQLLQSGMSGKEVAAAVGCAPSVISRWRDYLMGMKAPPLEEVAVDEIRSNYNEIKQEIKQEAVIEPAPLPPQQIEETQTAPVRQTNIGPGSEAPVPDPEESKPVSRPVKLEKPTLPIRKEPNIQVDISIGKGRVHLEAETPRQLVTLVNMLATMIETNEE